MFTWSYEHTVETTAAAAAIWRLWSAPDAWTAWDDGVEWVKLDGPFAKGSKGVMKPAGGPKVRFVMLAAEPNRGFTDRSLLPLTTLDFSHSYTPAAGSVRATITHRVEMRGWLTPLFSRVIGGNIKKGLPGAMRKLAALAEASA